MSQESDRKVPMPFFRSSPNLPDHEKARIEFHLQQLAECLGGDLLRQPVMDPEVTFGNDPSSTNLDEVLAKIGKHLGMDVRPITIQTSLKSPEVCGGGG